MKEPQQKMGEPQKVSARQTCASCAGTGTWAVSLAYVVSCLVCGGKGHVSIAQPAGPCHNCGGSGKRNKTALCLTCAGTGWERVFAQNVGGPAA
jgi:DnaJ-class molecular chaperone